MSVFMVQKRTIIFYNIARAVVISVNTINTPGYSKEYDCPIINTENRNYQHYVIDDEMTWTEAKTAAENSTYNGVRGQLATLTRAREDELVDNLVSDDSRVWMGLSDTATKWAYAWVTGE